MRNRKCVDVVWMEEITFACFTDKRNARMAEVNVLLSLSRNHRCVFNSKRKYQMLLLEFVCTVEILFMWKKKERKWEFAGKIWAPKLTRTSFIQNFLYMRCDMNSFSFLFFNCFDLNSITIARRSRWRTCWQWWFLFLFFTRKWIWLLLLFLLLCDCNVGRVRHRQTFTFFDDIQFFLVGRTKCECFVHVEFNSFSTELTWLLQHWCLLMEVHNWLTRFFAQILLQRTVLTSDHIPIVFYLELQKQRVKLFLGSFGVKFSVISYDWFDAGQCADRCFLVTTFMNEKLFHNARRALYLCA